MRTTVDLPDDLFRQIKARAALQGLKLKEYVTRALQDSLFDHQIASEIGEARTEYGEETLELADDCVFPLISGATTATMRRINEAKVEEILADDEADDALPAGGR